MLTSGGARTATGAVRVAAHERPATVIEFPRSWPGPVDVVSLGRSSVAPFVVGEDRELLTLADGGIAGFVRRGRWAVFATDPVTPPGTEGAAVDEILERMGRAGLRPIFVAVVDPDVYHRRGLDSQHAADDPLIDLATFSLAGKRRSSIRHSVASARRSGLRVEGYASRHTAGCARLSAAWLATKRGGEMGFTLGRFAPNSVAETDCRVVIDRSGAVVAFVTWHRYNDGRARVLDLMRRSPDAPNPAMDIAIADSLAGFAAEGVEQVSLGCVPISHGRIAERIYPTRSLYRFKDKFAPVWEPRYMVAPPHAARISVMVAVARAYNPGGLWGALRHNG